MDDLTQEQKQLDPQIRQLLKGQSESDIVDELSLLLDPQMLELQSEDPLSQMLMRQIMARPPLAPVISDTVAAGTPFQQTAPAKKTYKAQKEKRRRAREEENRHAKEASEQCPVGNIVTYDIKHQLGGYHTRKNSLFDSYFPITGYDKSGRPIRDTSKNRSGVDTRVLQIFSHAFRTDEAAVSADAKYQQEGEAFYDAFCSTDNTRRAPYLQRMVEEVLNFNLKENMFSEKSLRSNAATFKSMADRIVYMENVINDENNAFFFDTPLSPVSKENLKKTLDILKAMPPAFMTACQKRGVEPDHNRYVSEREAIDAYSVQAKKFAGEYKGKPKEYQRMKESLKQEGAEQRSPEIYRQPSEIYHQIRSILEGDVQKILDCNVEKLSALSDIDLQKRREELDKLYAASLRAERCLPIKHPYQHNLTLKEDLTGQRKLEYEYKSALLRGLVERADGFTKQGEQTIKRAAERYQKQMTPGTPEFQEFFDYLRFINFSSLVTVDPKYDDVAREYYMAASLNDELPKQPPEEVKKRPEEVKKWLEEAKKRLEEAEKRLEEEFGTGEMITIVKRLKSEHYFSLNHTKEDLERLKKPSDIGECLFRSTSSFLKTEAAETLLTPEQFRRMLFNLGAGAGLTPDSSEADRKPAIEKNNAGLDTLREVMAAQYDMLERKYGNSIEQMTIEDIMGHYVDIAKDFANLQVDYHMATRFPGFIRENNPDDERLGNQILYYNQCGFLVLDIIVGIGSYIPAKEVSDKTIRDMFENTFKIPKNANRLKAKEALMKNSSFRHPLDWSQKVKNPADAE